MDERDPKDEEAIRKHFEGFSLRELVAAKDDLKKELKASHASKRLEHVEVLERNIAIIGSILSKRYPAKIPTVDKLYYVPLPQLKAEKAQLEKEMAGKDKTPAQLETMRARIERLDKVLTYFDRMKAEYFKKSSEENEGVRKDPDKASVPQEKKAGELDEDGFFDVPSSSPRLGRK